MLKLTAVLSLMLIAIWSQADSKRQKKETASYADFVPGSTMWAATLSCESCGSECAAACGTRHFRSCCFNYLRRKRGPELPRVLPQTHDIKSETRRNPRPLYVIENPSESWLANLISSDFKPSPFEDPIENRLQLVYDV